VFSGYDAFVGTMPAHKEKVMSKLPAGQINPANLWGKPMPTLSARVASRGGKSADSELDDIAEPNDDDLAAEEDAYEDESAEDVRETSKKLTRQEIEAVDEDPDDAEEEEENEEESDIAPEEGDDDVDLLSDNASSTVEDEVDDDVTEGVTTMAEKKSGADHIRDEINKRQAAGDSLRGVDIVNALAKKRVTVSAAQVSQLLKAAGVAASRGPRAERNEAASEKSRMAAKGKKQAPTAAAPTGRSAPKVKPTPAAASGLPMAQLEAAAAFLETCDGCYDTASEILATHHRLGQMYSRISK